MSPDTTTEPAYAIDTMRLARLTVGPNRSPSRSSAGPLARPTRTSDSDSSSWYASASESAISMPMSVPSTVNITSSPIIFTTRPPSSPTTSYAVDSKRSTIGGELVRVDLL